MDVVGMPFCSRTNRKHHPHRRWHRHHPQDIRRNSGIVCLLLFAIVACARLRWFKKRSVHEARAPVSRWHFDWPSSIVTLSRKTLSEDQHQSKWLHNDNVNVAAAARIQSRSLFCNFLHFFCNFSNTFTSQANCFIHRVSEKCWLLLMCLFRFHLERILQRMLQHHFNIQRRR